MEVVLYTREGCPKCKVLKSKLDQKGISYTLVEDPKEVVKFGKEHKIMSAPILKVNNAVFDYASANAWVNDVKIDTEVVKEEPRGTILNGEPIDCKEECKF